LVDLRARLKALPAHKRERFLAALTVEELRELERLSEGLLDFIPRVSSQFAAPRHLQPLVEVLEAAEHTPQRVVVSTPPQFGKTTLALHGLLWLLGRAPKRRNAYVTYEATRAEQMSLQAREIGLEAGLRTVGSRKIWRTHEGGGLIATGIGGPLTGYGVDGLMLVDDPVKNRAEAESATYRERTDQWFRDVALTRCHPSASVIVVQTRWHEDDLAGRLIKRGWKRINLQAIDDNGKSLWEAMWPAKFLTEVKRPDVGEYTWWSLFQGEPRPRGGSLFQNAMLYDVAPPLGAGFRVGVGIDLAYSKKTHADYSVAVVLMRLQNPDPAIPPLFYVLDVRREQVQAPVFKGTLRSLRSTYLGAPMRWYAAGPEIGIGDFIKASDGALPGIPIEVLPAVGDKFVRAQPVAAAWNAGRILVPRNAPWAGAFLAELASFTGVNDANDDQVDALGTAYDLLAGGAASRFAMLSQW
jgi:predicted phage terminase large subunit-like protein